MNTPDLLDPAELMQLALQATERLDSGAAIEYLRRLLNQQPDHAEALYLLGAQQAQLGLFARALDNMARAVALRPDIHIARFQLGWLQMNAGDTASAEATWEPLASLGPSHPYLLFKTGLLHLARHEVDDCLRCLRAGIAANDLNLPLNADMGTLVDHVERRRHEAAARSAAAPEAASDVPAMYLDAYTGKKP